MQEENPASPPSVKGFWTGEKIHEKRDELFQPSRADAVECAAYVLRMGPEVYVSPDDQTANAKDLTVRQLGEDERFRIPPGQFAFLLTEEIVTVPKSTVAFISMKAKVKWKGLINVSGFHADPGFKGRLIFAVFNAGPVVIHLRRGDDLFLIWFADLIGETLETYKKPPQLNIPSDLINGISGELQSLPGLSTRIRELETDLHARVHAIEKVQEGLNVRRTLTLTIGGAILITLGGLAAKFLIPDSGDKPRMYVPVAPPAIQEMEYRRSDEAAAATGRTAAPGAGKGPVDGVPAASASDKGQSNQHTTTSANEKQKESKSGAATH